MRRIIAIMLIALALGVLILTPVVVFTPVGAMVASQFSGPTPTAMATPTITPLPSPIPTPPPTPELTVVGTPPVVKDKAAYLMDDRTGNTLDDFHGEAPLPMASTTKIMTAVIAIQTADPNMVVTVHQDAIDEVVNNGGSSAQLVVGDQIALKDLLYGLMLPSGDDAAVAIADAVGGSVPNFVRGMNILAYRLGLFQTHYSNADGLNIPNHYTTAYDLVRLARYAMSIPTFAQVVSTRHYVLPASAHHHRYIWDTTNALFGPTLETPSIVAYAGATGIKTGYTAQAGYCLVFSATRNGQNLIGVALFSTNTDAKQRFLDAAKLLNWGFGLPLRVARG